ncbi:zinc-binding dehydrogenase [Streptomyces sp. NPDC048278]|uniref:zinc-binding dehydrogenase n=1 Tax=unclassified Streptomyces TaxID=2593676 RepID=UPI0034248E8E
MRAAVLRNKTVRVGTAPDPVPGPGQLLVRSLACGICASDLHYMDHPEAGEDDDSGMSTYDQDVGIVMRHEYCVEVVGHGPGTARRIPVGARVGSLPILVVPGGRKIIGQNPEAPGGFGEYFLLTEALTRLVLSDLPSELVCVADAMAVGWSAASRAQVTSTEVPLVIGCGAIGLATVAALKSLGVGPVIAADFVASRRRTALAMGADVVVDPAELSPYEAWREAAGAGDSGCVVFECVGLPGVLDSVIKQSPGRTRVLSMGGPPQGDVLHTLTAKRKGINIQFGGGPTTDHWNEAFDAVGTGRLDVRPLLGRTVGLEQVPQALDAARAMDAPARIVVVP